jgi:hypothetical protein
MGLMISSFCLNREAGASASQPGLDRETTSLGAALERGGAIDERPLILVVLKIAADIY